MASSEMKPPHFISLQRQGYEWQKWRMELALLTFQSVLWKLLFSRTHLVWYCSLILSRLSAFIVSQSSISHLYPCSNNCHPFMSLRVFHKRKSISAYHFLLMVYLTYKMCPKNWIKIEWYQPLSILNQYWIKTFDWLVLTQESLCFLKDPSEHPLEVV